jgi:hypothetical protein
MTCCGRFRYAHSAPRGFGVLAALPCFRHLGLLGLFVALTGCASSLSPPFSAMKGQAMTVYWLQSYEPAPPAQANANSSTIGGIVLPQEIQQLGQQLLATGMQLFPGFLQGLVPPAQAAAQPADVPRFHGFPIRKYQQVTDPAVQKSILELFGHKSNFKAPTETCMYADFGFALAQPGGQQPADILVSLSCQQVRAYNIVWPYAQTGLTQDALGKVGTVVNKVFQGT